MLVGYVLVAAHALASFHKLDNTDACVKGGTCNIAKHLNKTVEELSALCDADSRCMCHNERWLKSDCSGLKYSKGTTLYVKDAKPTPPTPGPPPTPPPTPFPQLGTDVWPTPQKYSLSGDQLPLSSSFSIHVISSSSIAQASASRYQKLIKPTASVGGLKTLQVLVNNSSELLGSSTNYSYTLTILSWGSPRQESATISCQSPFGVAYALETFAQLVLPTGNIIHDSVRIKDYPSHKHRGILLDIGRRFYPVDFLRTLIDGISYAKMNVLHLHFSDFPASRIESKIYPQLTAKLVSNVTGQRAYYTQAELQQLVVYAKERGVRVVPELDVPGHAGGLASLVGEGLTYCDSSVQKTLLDDSRNKTWGLVKQLVSGLPVQKLIQIHINNDLYLSLSTLGTQPQGGRIGAAVRGRAVPYGR
jgi:hypothetical protein